MVWYPIAWVESAPMSRGGVISGLSDRQHTLVAPILASDFAHGLQERNHELLVLQRHIGVTEITHLQNPACNLIPITLFGPFVITFATFVSAANIGPPLIPLRRCPLTTTFLAFTYRAEHC